MVSKMSKYNDLLLPVSLQPPFPTGRRKNDFEQWLLIWFNDLAKFGF